MFMEMVIGYYLNHGLKNNYDSINTLLTHHVRVACALSVGRHVVLTYLRVIVWTLLLYFSYSSQNHCGFIGNVGGLF